MDSSKKWAEIVLVFGGSSQNDEKCSNNCGDFKKHILTHFRFHNFCVTIRLFKHRVRLFLSIYLQLLSRSITDHHLRCGGWLNFEFSKRGKTFGMGH